MQETDRPLTALFTGNLQVGANDNLAEAIARVRFTDDSLRFHFQVRVFKFRVARDCVERRNKATRERIHQQVFRCPPAFETAELRWRGEMDSVRGRIRLGDTHLSGRPPRYNAVLIFIFHSVLQCPASRFPKVGVAAPPTDSGDGSVTVTTTIVPDDSVPANPSKRWPRSHMFVMPITRRVLQYAHLEGAECALLTA